MMVKPAGSPVVSTLVFSSARASPASKCDTPFCTGEPAGQEGQC